MNNILTHKEQFLLDRALPRSGVVYLEGRPGEAKSAIVESIARKTNRRFFDIRLCHMDETDLGLYPDVDKSVEIEKRCVKHLPPEWALEANNQPSIIMFDELNRAPLVVRNAALQILLDKRIGWKFKFNDDVLFFSAGNVGEVDGCDVEEFDAALWGRLIHVKHKLSLSEWIDGFAKENVWDVIVSYLRAYPERLYERSNNTKVYASPRSWTFLSDFIKKKFDGFESATTVEVRALLEVVGSDYIGNSITKFIRYLEDLSVMSIKDVINKFEEVEDKLKTFNRSKMTELLTSLKEFEFDGFNEKHLNNIEKFLKLMDKDESVSYLIASIDAYPVDSPNFLKVKEYILRFPELRMTLKQQYNVDNPTE